MNRKDKVTAIMIVFVLWALILGLSISSDRHAVAIKALDQRIQKLEERCMPPHIESDEKKEIGT